MLYHEGVFYDRTKKIELNKDGLRVSSLPSVIKIPHASWSIIYPLLVTAFSTVQDLKPSLIVPLAPLHNQRIACEDNSSAFTCSFTKEGNINFLKDKELFEGCRIKEEDCYFEEEAGIEILYPFIEKTFPGIPVLPLFADNNSLNLDRIIKCLLNKTGQQVLFLLSSNNECAKMWEKQFNIKWKLLASEKSKITHKVEIGIWND